MDRKAFYDALRTGPLYASGLSQGVVEGFENLLDVWEKHFPSDPLNWLAYNLATAYHETARTMQPITERGARSYFDKYDPGTRLGTVLGNTVKGDGYRFRGEGHVQNTGRRNAAFATKRLNEVFGLGIDLVADPDKRGDPFISAMSLFLGNKEGWWTGKDLADYIDDVDEGDAEDLREFVNARRIVNGTDKATTIGNYAIVFERALKAAGHAPIGKADPMPPAPQDPIRARVMAVQTRLTEEGFPCGPVDGWMGAKTQAAIEAFRADRRITPDILDATTASVLGL